MGKLTMREVAAIMKEREAALEDHRIGARFAMALHELDESELREFVNRVCDVIHLSPTPDLPTAFLAGLELGRELERRNVIGTPANEGNPA